MRKSPGTESPGDVLAMMRRVLRRLRSSPSYRPSAAAGAGDAAAGA